MLFNSLEFIVFFLPLAMLGYYGLQRLNKAVAPVVWLVLLSLGFYSWWRVDYLPLLLASILGNYGLGLFLGRDRAEEPARPLCKLVLTLGIGANLSLLGYYKYADMIVDSINGLMSLSISGLDIVLPLAISFFTFQQIAYLMDSYQGKTKHYGFWHYCLFVSFFPQLIAGPIVHHRQMMPQFIRNRHRGFRLDNIAIGVAIFAFGLAKKVLIADNLAGYATPVFDKADAGGLVTFVEAWQAVMAYSLQLYFDFSGYCDMATGAARCFGIILPINFNSPYRSKNIIDFWRRWHITLSNFLRDYLYIPLGGNRKGQVRRYLNLFVTMLLGGLWHGAGWNFVIWGGLHGFYLTVNHGWHALQRHLFAGWRAPRLLNRSLAAAGFALTILSVMFAWVFFRAQTFDGALAVLEGMAGHNGVVVPAKYLGRWGDFGHWCVQQGVEFKDLVTLNSISPLWTLLALWVFVCKTPNIYQLLANYQPVLERLEPSRWQWQLTPRLGVLVGIALVGGLLSLNRVSEFLYFQF